MRRWRAPGLLLTILPLLITGSSLSPARAGPRPISGDPFPGYRLLRTNVIGVDDRHAPGGADIALTGAVGVIACATPDASTRRRSFGTGTLVGDSGTILTAAHVLSEDTPGDGPPFPFDAVQHCRFQQYGPDGGLLFEAGFRYAVYGAFRNNPGLPNEDWAVLRLAEQAPVSSRPLPFASLSLSELSRDARIPVSVLAFHADIRGRRRLPLISVGEVFTVAYAGFERLAHTADMGRMSSGAALVNRTAGGANVVIGLHRSAARFDAYNLGVPITGDLADTLNSFTRGPAIEPGRLLARAAAAGSRANPVDGFPTAE